MIARRRGGSDEVWFVLMTRVEGIVRCQGPWAGRTGFRYRGTARARESDHPEECLFSVFRVFWLANDVGGAHEGLVSRCRGVWRELR